MKLKSVNGDSTLQVSEAAFGDKFNEALVHQVLKAYRNAGRAGTKAQKSRAEVRGGGRKPHAQKGTGQARAGSSRSPIWVGGGRTFAAKPRDFAQKVNRKMYRGAIRSMLSELARTERLLVTDGIQLEAPKTKLLAEQLKAWSLASVLIVVEASDEKLYLAARNLPHVEVIEVTALNPLSLAAYDKVLMTVGAVKLIEERLQARASSGVESQPEVVE
jgi:large subunit ribosomal protein L4